MRLAKITDVVGGVTLAHDVPNAALGAGPLLRRGVVLTPNMIGRLQAYNISTVWIEDELSKDIDPGETLPDGLRGRAEGAVSSCLVEIEQSGPKLLSPEALREIKDAVTSIVDILAGDPRLMLRLDSLASADSYSYAHSVRVTTLGLLLGHRVLQNDGWTDWKGEKRYDRLDERLTDLGAGLLIHDIGKAVIPESVLNKNGPLTAEEFDLVKSHAAVGAQMVSTEHLSPLSIAVIRDHHEKWDGTGYGNGKVGLNIPQFARIAALADVYDAVTSERPYKAGQPTWMGVKVIRDGSGNHFDPTMAKHFLDFVHPYPKGTTIKLNSETEGVVVDVDAVNPDYPLVRYRRGERLTEKVLHIEDGVVLSDL